MTANRGLFVRNNGAVGTTPIEGRLVLASLVAENTPGTPRNGLLDQKATTVVSGTASMTYSVGACNVVVNRAAGEGVYMFNLTGTTTVATTAAPGTGSRWDLIYVKQNDVDKGDANNTAVLAVLQGTSSTGTPTKPYASLPAGAYVLAEAQVSTGATATNGAQVTISQVWRYTSLRGVPVPVRTQAERDEITPTTGLRVARLDRDAEGDVTEVWNGTVWEVVGPKEMVFQNTGFGWGANSAWDAGTLSVNNGAGASSQMSSPQPTFATAGSLSGTIKFTEPGVYAVTWTVVPSGEPNNAGYRIVPSGTWPGSPASIADTIFGQGIHMSGQTHWETVVTAPFIRVPQANLEVRLTGIQITATTNIALVRVVQIAKL